MFAAIQKNKNMTPEEREKAKAERMQRKQTKKRTVFTPPPIVRYETVGPFKDKDKVPPMLCPFFTAVFSNQRCFHSRNQLNMIQTIFSAISLL